MNGYSVLIIKCGLMKIGFELMKHRSAFVNGINVGCTPARICKST